MNWAAQRGASLVEVLVSLLLVSLVFLGAISVMGRVTASHADSRQHMDALALLAPIAQAMSANRQQAAHYVTALQGIGQGTSCPISLGSQVQRDLAAWCLLLQQSTGVQGLWGARGCIEAQADGLYRVTLAWRGFMPTVAPQESVACAAHLYDDAACPDDRCRRVHVWLIQGKNK